MATYVNDLRLKEIATGDESGTWGTSTNTNLELIAEAFSFGTEAITTNADTHTTTIADGSTDPGRSIYLKYTGALDSDCTITIGPNTVSKLWFIENATTDSGSSGPYNIVISQGSGANVTIPNGHVKAIYSDGAGSGAAMVDAFTDLNLAGTTTVDDLTVSDDLTVTDDVAIGGLATVGGTLGVTGVVTANAGVVVDNITIDGQEIDVSSGNLTLDVAGEIKLDSDDGIWRFQDNGGSMIELSIGSGSSPTFFTAVSDADLVFRGNDGGSAVTALTLDMSDGGTAIFGSWQKMADNNRIVFGAGSDMSLFSDGTDGNILVDGELSVDVSGDIILDAGGGDVIYHVAGADRGRLTSDSNGFTIRSDLNNGDLFFKGVDGGSEITALTFDMSDAGAATFNSSITVANTISISSSNTSAFIQASDNVFQFGTSSDDPMLFFANNAERMRINSAGNLLIGTTTDVGVAGGGIRLTYPTSESDGDVYFSANGGGSNANPFVLKVVSQNLYDSGVAAMYVGRHSGNSRSINAGGTVNASGADYAEYMKKADSCGTIAKGDVCGVDSTGKLTDVFDNAISFVIKSTDPSYVGGDTWGSVDLNLTDEQYETERQKHDRIAFSGQVPVNITGSFNVGDYVYPQANGTAIQSVAKSNPTFEEYKLCVGKIWATQSDGKPLVAVKIG